MLRMTTVKEITFLVGETHRQINTKSRRTNQILRHMYDYNPPYQG
jgi:hypothetical protein